MGGVCSLSPEHLLQRLAILNFSTADIQDVGGRLPECMKKKALGVVPAGSRWATVR